MSMDDLRADIDQQQVVKVKKLDPQPEVDPEYNAFCYWKVDLVQNDSIDDLL